MARQKASEGECGVPVGSRGWRELSRGGAEAKSREFSRGSVSPYKVPKVPKVAILMVYEGFSPLQK